MIEINSLLSRLSDIGYSEGYIREKVLPFWWDAELESNPMAVLELAGIIAQSLDEWHLVKGSHASRSRTGIAI